MEDENLLKIAREAIETFVRAGKRIEPPSIRERKGVFVTIYKLVNGRKLLRGCIGYPYPDRPLGEALVDAAISATRDPRFDPLKPEELPRISIEISILTEPEFVGYGGEEILEKIKIGDGLLIRKGILSGLLLPQVWEEINDKEKFLSALCMKAGLPPEAWRYDRGIEFYKFGVKKIVEP